MRQIMVCTGLVFLLCGCSQVNDSTLLSSNEQTQSNERPSLEADIEILASQLEIPWAITKLGETFYITERTGKIAKIEHGEMTRQEVNLDEILSTAAEAGLLGFVLAPDFMESNQAFAYYTYEKEGIQFNRIVSLQLENNQWHEQQVLVDEIPSGTYHHGGRLKIGPDNKLYATTGDASNADIAQNLASLGGKILRLNLDGSIPTDNPFPNSYVYSYGHRNPQGITWAPNGKMYASEHGQSANDEINEIHAGQNYGWPIIEGTEKQDGLVSPLVISGENKTWAPSGVVYYNDELYVAALRGTAIFAFHIETNQVREVVNQGDRIRDVWIEEGILYWLSNNIDGRGSPSINDDQLYKMKLNSLD